MQLHAASPPSLRKHTAPVCKVPQDAMTPDQITGDAELDAALHKYMDARADLHRLIREARAAGMTLRHIASIVGLSVETIRKITMKEGT